MNLKCKINSKEYSIVQGCTFSEEYNETLDSGSIIISHVDKIKDLRPYDDVFIYSGDFTGYTNDDKVTKSLPIVINNSVVDNKILCSISAPKKLLEYASDSTLLNMTIKGKVEEFYSITGLRITKELIYKLETNNATEIVFTPYTSLGYIFNIEYKKTPKIVFKKLSSDSTASLNFNFYPSSDNLIPSIIKIDSEFSFSKEERPEFYKHLLVDQFTEEIINLKEKKYKYKIQLFSETKKLETIQLPNISITEPLKKDKKSIYDYIKQFVEMYSPKIKMVSSSDDKIWTYKNKYTLSSELINDFSDCYSPDFSINSPNLRDVLAKLMLVKDRIPYVKDDVIYSLDITERTGKFDPENVNYITSSMTSDNYCDSLKRTYSEALSQDNSCRMIEYLGFRNSSTALMTIENMRLETSYPIYKINKIYMCYYKTGKIFSTREWISGKDYYINERVNYNNKYYECIKRNQDTEFTESNWKELDTRRTFLCKQDITPLVKLDTERNLLSQDWSEFTQADPSIEELSKFKLCTVGYSIGSKYIEGWGTKYTYPVGWWNITASYIENIFRILDSQKQFGIYDYNYITRGSSGVRSFEKFVPDSGDYILSDVASAYDTPSLKLKSFIFIVDYNAFYNGTIIHSKDKSEGNIMINDNASASLTLLEEDGLFQKEKLNRFGNKAMQFNARYSSWYKEDVNGNKVENIQKLGSVYNQDDEEDVIIYHREYSISDNVITCTYYGMKDYVLKNYFTSVYAKHRTWNLMSYGESVRRAENRKTTLILSKNKCYYENENPQIDFNEFYGSNDYLSRILSFTTKTPAPISADNFILDDKINYGYITHNDKSYACDLNAFVSGNSLCFNLSMFDNASMGVYIKKHNPTFSEDYNKYDKDDNGILNWDAVKKFFDFKSVKDDYSGSVQDWYFAVDDVETGFTKNLGFHMCHIDQKKEIYDKVMDYVPEDIKNVYIDKLFKMPLINIDDYSSKANIIGKDVEINKDNKEVIDLTFQIEPIANDKEIIFSSWMLKLSDLLSNYLKIPEDSDEYKVPAMTEYQSAITGICTTKNAPNYSGVFLIDAFGLGKIPIMILRVPKSSLEDGTLRSNMVCSTVFTFDKDELGWFSYIPPEFSAFLTYYSYSINEILAVDKNAITTKGIETERIRKGTWGGHWESCIIPNVEVRFNRIEMEWDRLSEFAYFSSEGKVFNYISRGGGIRMIDTTNIYCSNGKYCDNYTKDTLGVSNSNYINVPASNAGEIKYKRYDRNMFIGLSSEEMPKTIIYNEYKNKESAGIDDNYLVSDIFKMVSEENEAAYISVNMDKIKEIQVETGKEIKSVQYWYLDNDSYKFVFGVNITEEDYKNSILKIYVSVISDRDTKVYDQFHNVVGYINNYADSNNEKKYGVEQYYQEK